MLSATPDGTHYVNRGTLKIAKDVPEDLLRQKIARYDNRGTTIGPPNLLGILAGLGDNRGIFKEEPDL
jgi:hypothetical protein